VIAQAGQDEEVLLVDCDLSLIERQRRDWPFLRDRRIDAYDGLLERYLDQD
jgi:N-carbamoylputrescine amidase